MPELIEFNIKSIYEVIVYIRQLVKTHYIEASKIERERERDGVFGLTQISQDREINLEHEP